MQNPKMGDDLILQYPKSFSIQSIPLYPNVLCVQTKHRKRMENKRLAKNELHKTYSKFQPICSCNTMWQNLLDQEPVCQFLTALCYPR